ncbi:transposase [Aliarcobacter butzleri]|uniref:transposase n=1 Tax=Aliarcobacter butzleri TaxID=28197 RepID=UPI0021B6AE3E|nr:transposase [Aliarcobacter butzleri]MCT7651031.1 transposase [Aliarcobacter butzleri]
MRQSKYSQEYKDSAIQLCIKTDMPLSHIANDLGMSDKTLSLWVREYKKLHNVKSSKEVKQESLEEENKRLRRELSIAKQERDILKKAAAYFAKETL